MQEEMYLKRQVKELKQTLDQQARLITKIFGMIESITDFKNTPFMTRVQVAAYFHVSTRTVDRWKEEGQLLPISKDRRILYYKAEVLKFSETHYKRH